MPSIKIYGLAIILIGVLLSGCGPSPEEQTATAAALTAAAATSTLTPTPTTTPTPTPTPIPFDLSVLVTGDEEAPILGASVFLAEIGEEGETLFTGDRGQAVWYDLPGEAINLSVSAQGYFSVETSETIERGENQLTVALERDPFGLLPSEVCLPGEKLLYIEDFQDGEAQGWSEIEFRARGWDIVPNPDTPSDLVVINTLGSEIVNASLQNLSFDDAVWRAQFMYTGERQISFDWHATDKPYEIEDGEVTFSRYGALFGPVGFYAGRLTLPVRHIHLTDYNHTTIRGVWHTIEISTYDGVYEVWKDGNRMILYEDPQPLPSGGIYLNIDNYYGGDQSIVYFDNFVVCELTAPFVPMTTLEP